MTEEEDGHMVVPDNVPRQVVLDRQALVPIGVAVAAGSSLLAMALWANNRFTGVTTSVDLLRLDVTSKIDRIEEKIDANWTSRDMRQWADLLRANNKDVINVPEVK